jgi:hypothetical protein
MKKVAFLIPVLALWCIGCPPRADLPPGVRSLRQQHHKTTIALPVWSLDVAEEVESHPADYAGRILAIDRAYLDPQRDVRIDERRAAFPLRGGGMVMMETELVPAWLRHWTGAPLKLRAVVHPPRAEGNGGAAAGPLLRGLAIDFAHPLELASVAIERTEDGTWLEASIENLRGTPAGATLEVRFGAVRDRREIAPIAPGGAAHARVQLSGEAEPRWRDLGPDARRLRLAFEDKTSVTLDLGHWLEDPAEALVDLGYTFTAPGNGVLALSVAEAELERFAALELRSYLAQFTDANLEPREPEASEPLPEQPLLVVGSADHNPWAAALVRQAGLADRVRDAGPEGYVLKSLPHEGRPALLVTSQTARGLVHGVYGLLEHYGVRFTMRGARLPARGEFRLPDVDETKSPVFAVRRLVAAGPERAWTARWSQWQWISMFDQAAKNRFSEVVVPLDGLEPTFTYTPGQAALAAFPYEVGPYACVAEARLAHQQGLAVLADYARRRGLDLVFARTTPEGKLTRVAPPECVAGALPPGQVGEAIDVMTDPGDFLGFPRVAATAKAAAALLAAKSPVVSLPYRRGAGARAGFVAKLAWGPELTPQAYYTGWAATLCNGKDAERLGKAMLELDQLSDELLAATPRPFGLGPALVFPVSEGDLACHWEELRARATSQPVAELAVHLKGQTHKLDALQRKLEPIHTACREALGNVTPPWEAPLYEAVPSSRRAERLSQNLYLFRAFLGGMAAVQEGTLAYHSALAEPEQALPRLSAAATSFGKAQHILALVQRRAEGTDLEPVFATLAERVAEQTRLLAEWLGPAHAAEPAARLRIQGSDAVVHLFRTRNANVYAVYRIAGPQVVHLQLPAEEARLVRHGQEPKTMRAEAGVFLVDVDRVPTYIVARRAAWPGQPSP